MQSSNIESMMSLPSADMPKLIMRSIVDDCSPIHWDVESMIVKLRELSLVVHPDKCSHTNAPRCFAAVMDVRRKLLKLGKVDHLWSLKSREIFYGLGCCPEHLVYSNRVASFPKFQTCNQFVWLLRGPHSFDLRSVAAALSVIRKEAPPKEVQELPAEDFHVETVFLLARGVAHWVISQVNTEAKKRVLYAKAANLSYVSTLPNLEDRRKYTERIVLGVSEILQSLNVSVLPKLPTLKSFEIRSEMRVSASCQSSRCETKPKAQVVAPPAKRKKPDAKLDPRRVTVRVPDAKLTSRFYQMACDYAKENPNEWHPRSAFTTDLTEKEYHSMRGAFIMKKSNGKDADYFPQVEYTCTARNSFLMTHLGKGTPVQFRWND
jgi:hypothetical protein